MNLQKILAASAIAMAITACSSDEFKKDVVLPGATTDGYMSVNLQLPTTTGTRANDDFSDGDASEYDVDNGLLVLFKAAPGVNENSAVYCGAFDFGFPHKPDTDKDNQSGNVTTQYKRCVKVSGLTYDRNDRIYGLVLLNYDMANIELTDKGLMIGGTLCMPDIPATATEAAIPGTTFADVRAMTSKSSFTLLGNPGEIAKSILMTNSPLATKPGGNYNPTSEVKINTLVDLTDGLFPSQQEALDNPAGTIYVERAVAKITCSNFLGQTQLKDGKIYSKLDLEDGSKLYISNIRWAVGNEETDSYIVRNADNIDWTLASSTALGNLGKYRMVGEKSLRQNVDNAANNTLLYRPYFCIDPNYATDKEATGFGEKVAWDGNQAFYAHENTFKVENMKYKNTTRVGFWVTLVVGENGEARTFYTRNDETNRFYFDTTVDGQTFNPLQRDIQTDISKNDDVKAAWTAALNQASAGSATFNPAADLVITTAPDASGRLMVTDIKFKDNANIYTQTPTYDFTRIMRIANVTYQYNEYTDGEAFYEVRVKHFGDDLTPWSNSDFCSTIDESYPATNRDNEFLGRYGLVRNNWYDLHINNLLTLGYPRDPADWDASWGDTPDDSNDRYLAVRISVLSWAKRVQEVEF